MKSIYPPIGSSIQYRFLYPPQTFDECVGRGAVDVMRGHLCPIHHRHVYAARPAYFEGPVVWVNELPHMGILPDKVILILPTRQTEHLLKIEEWLGPAVREVGFLATRGASWSVGGGRWKARPVTAHGILEVTGSLRDHRSSGKENAWWHDPLRDIVPGIVPFREAIDAGARDLWPGF